MVAMISFCHAVQFFDIGNERWMSIVLAFSFELGLALSLASILLSDKNKSQTFPWILMIALTTVQVVGNVYSVFKYVSVSQEDYYQYLANSLLFFLEEVDQNTIRVIVSWIMGAILPIVALLMTDMVASNIKFSEEESGKKQDLPDQVKPKVSEKIKEDTKTKNDSVNDDSKLFDIKTLKNLFGKKAQTVKKEIPVDTSTAVPEQEKEEYDIKEHISPDDLELLDSINESIPDEDLPADLFEDTFSTDDDSSIQDEPINMGDYLIKNIDSDDQHDNHEESLADYYHILADSSVNKDKSSAKFNRKKTDPYIAEIINDPFRPDPFK